jgi:sulfate transport system permease protein
MTTAVARPVLRPAIRHDPWYVRVPLIATAVVFLTVMVLVPLVHVFYQALAMGWQVTWQALLDPDTRSAAQVTFIATFGAVSANLVFGLAAAWALTRTRFRGKTLLAALIDLPFAVSPVVAGLLFVLLFGAQGYLGPFCQWLGIQVVFAVPGIVLATTFVTLPFIAHELVPVMEAVGRDEEEAAAILGASGWQIFWWITLPNIRWGLLYGITLCTARALGEFGAVSVVSGKLAGRTDTLPIQIEKLYQSLGVTALASAFSVAAFLTLLALATLAAKVYLQRRRLGSPR